MWRRYPFVNNQLRTPLTSHYLDDNGSHYILQGQSQLCPDQYQRSAGSAISETREPFHHRQCDAAEDAGAGYQLVIMTISALVRSERGRSGRFIVEAYVLLSTGFVKVNEWLMLHYFNRYSKKLMNERNLFLSIPRTPESKIF